MNYKIVNYNIVRVLCILVCIWSLSGALYAQEIDNQDIKELIQLFKESRKGPYLDIRWFCPDGSLIPPKEECPDPGGHQRARYNSKTEALAQSNHLFLGQILATTPFEDFWDDAYQHSRLKQFQLEKYLRSIDNGWILKRAQYYRGALQVEDEEAWGAEFLQWLLDQEDIVHRNFFLVRQAVKDIPHKEDSQRARIIRALSKSIAEGFERFTYLRVKIHGQPQESDLPKVIKFRNKYERRLGRKELIELDQLIFEMESYYKEDNLLSLRKYLSTLSTEHEIHRDFNYLTDNYAQEVLDAGKLFEIADIMWSIRKTMPTITDVRTKLDLLDLSIHLEELLNKEQGDWQPLNLKELLLKTYLLSKVAAACGFLETWEWEKAQATFKVEKSETIELKEILLLHQRSNSWIEWSAAMVRANYINVTDKFAAFEPLSNGFVDDLIRRSVLLHFGRCVNELSEFVAAEAGFSNSVLDIDHQSQIRGLNPGYTKGELVVVDGSPENIQVSRDNIYLFRYPSSELKPVAGIGTVSEGNPVSHIQLLARNLGIPNAVFSNEHLEALKKYSGREIFYAVSNAGTVIMKLVEDMNAVENKLFALTEREESRIHIPTDRLDLDQTEIINLRDLDASHSGRICGPKAANLAQLKKIFPEQVVEGLVVPFGVFRAHMDQVMPGSTGSLWQFITETFIEVRKMEEQGYAELTIDDFVSGQLLVLQEAIQGIDLDIDFIKELESKFHQILGAPMGMVPVFVRSDTNMEDLKEFTGSGLNLTVFNVLDKNKIIQGIKDVWASPFKERSYQWRQQYMLNPENVYPSILIIPTVNVDHSGVLITKGIHRGTEKDLTIAFNLGGGGAVAGQATESYILYADGRNEMLFPAREPLFRKLPVSGGSNMLATSFELPILTNQNLLDIRQLSARIRDQMPKNLNTKGPFDVELGFKDDKLWLFQIRPYVENKKAKSSLYLESITPKLLGRKKILLSSSVNIGDHEL